MTPDQEDQLLRYDDGSLPPAERAQVDAARAEAPAMQAFLDDLASLRSALTEDTERPAPGSLIGPALASARAPHRKPQAGLLVLVALAAAILLVAIITRTDTDAPLPAPEVVQVEAPAKTPEAAAPADLWHIERSCAHARIKQLENRIDRQRGRIKRIGTSPFQPNNRTSS